MSLLLALIAVGVSIWHPGHSYGVTLAPTPVGCPPTTPIWPTVENGPVGWSFVHEGHLAFWLPGVADRMSKGLKCYPNPDVPPYAYALELVHVPDDSSLVGLQFELKGWSVGPMGGVHSSLPRTIRIENE